MIIVLKNSRIFWKKSLFLRKLLRKSYTIHEIASLTKIILLFMTNVFNIIKNQIFIVLPVFKKYYIPIEMLDDIDIFFP